MFAPRLSLVALCVVVCLGGAVQAQESSGTGGSSSGSTGGGSTGGSSSTPSSGLLSAPGAASSLLGPSAPLGQPAPTTATPSPAAPPVLGPAAVSSFGSPDPALAPPAAEPVLPVAPAAGSTNLPSESALPGGVISPTAAAPTTFSAPGFYGQPAQNFTLGQGRLARPRHSYTSSLSIGYDDNVFATPYNAETIPAVTEEVVVRQATPDRQEAYVVRDNSIVLGARPVTRFRTIKGKPEKRETIVLQPEIKPEKAIGSFVARASAGYQFQVGTRRTVFTADLNGSVSYMPNRPGDQIDFNGSVAFGLIHKVTPRLQISSTANAAYLSQPDIRRVNTPTSNVGDYFNLSARVDATYRWTKRLSTVTGLALNTTYYTAATQQGGSYIDFGLSNEGRYAWSPRLTLTLEGRMSYTMFPDDATRDSQTYGLLIGGQVILSQKLQASAKVGQSFRTYSSGQSAAATTPSLETDVTWRYSSTGSVSWSSKLGFEESLDPNVTARVLRTGITATQALGPRLKGTLGLNAVNNVSTNKTTDDTLGDFTFDLDASLNYTFSRHLSFNASYNFTHSISTGDGRDYLRNRIFVGLQYAF